MDLSKPPRSSKEFRERFGLKPKPAEEAPVPQPAPAQAPPAAEPESDKPAPKRKQLPPVIGEETVKCACGHEALFPLYPEKQDGFRKERRRKFKSKPCPACRTAARAEQEAARIGPKPPRRPKWRREADQHVPRLPHGATFHVSYDAEKQLWSGTLSIGELALAGETSGVFQLLALLDRKYRDWRDAQAQAAVPPPEGSAASAPG